MVTARVTVRGLSRLLSLTVSAPQRPPQPNIPHWIQHKPAHQCINGNQRILRVQDNQASKVQYQQQHTKQVAPITQCTGELSAVPNQPGKDYHSDTCYAKGEQATRIDG